MFTNLPVDEAVNDPSTILAKYKQEVDETRGKLRGLAGIVKELEKLAATKENLRHLAEHGVPRPRQSTEDSPRPRHTGQHGPAGNDDGQGDASSPSRREQVLNLLRQQPRRHWKAREIARALGIENVKSLRSSMDDFVRAGVVRKNPNTSTYYLEEPGDPTFF
jgi:hypothetical protein